MKMAYKWIQVAPKDVVWDNIDVTNFFFPTFKDVCSFLLLVKQDGIYETRFRYVTSWLLNFGLIVAWFFPVSFVGLLSNVSELCEKVQCVPSDDY